MVPESEFFALNHYDSFLCLDSYAYSIKKSISGIFYNILLKYTGWFSDSFEEKKMTICQLNFMENTPI